MPCSCEGYPPSPCAGDLLGGAEAALQRIKDLESMLSRSESKVAILRQELASVQEAFRIMGNGG